MVRTNAQIDALNSMREGDEPLIPYETEVGTIQLIDEQIGEQEKIKANAELKKTEEEKNKQIQPEEEKKDEDTDVEKLAAEADDKLSVEAQEKEKETKIEEPELDDEKILAYLKAKKGKEFSSVDEFINPKKELTPEEKEKVAEQREANKVAYGLSKGLFTNKQFENYITDSKNPTPLVLDAYIKDQKEKDSALTDAEIEAEFNEKFGLDEDKESRAYKTGQMLINNMASNIINKKYPKILNLEKDYSNYEDIEKKNKDYENKFQTQSPLYKKDIDQIKKEIKRVSIPISDKESFETDLDDSIIDEIIAQMSEDKFSKDQIDRGWEREVIKQTAQTASIIKSLPSLMEKYAAKKILAQQAGIRGVKPLGKEGERAALAKELTEDQKKAIAMMDEMIAN